MNDTAHPQKLAEGCAAAMLERDLTSNSLGMTLKMVSPGKASMQMTVRGDMVNGHGICHGGIIFTLADSTFAFACNTYDQLTVAASAEINFVNAVKAGEVLTTTATETFRKGRNGIYDILVTNQAGETVAVFRGKSRSLKATIL